MQFRLRRTIAGWAIAIAILLTFASCTRSTTPIYVAVNPWPGYAFLFLAEERGYFADEGLDVRLVELMSLGDVRRAFEEQHVQIMASTIVESILVSISSRLEPRVIYVCDKSNGGDVLIGQPHLRSVEDLVGCRIGYEAMSVDIIGILAALRHGNIALDQVTLIPMPQAELAAAFEAKQIDAIQCYPPTSLRLTADPSNVLLFDSSGDRTAVIDCLTTTREFAQTRPNDVQKLLRAYRRAISDYAEHPEEAVHTMALRTGVTEDEFVATLSGILIHDESNVTSDHECCLDVKQTIESACDSLRASSAVSSISTAESIAASLLEFYSHLRHD